MKVNFNNLRVQACNAHDRLVARLNYHILKDVKDKSFVEGFGWIGDGTIVIDAEQLEDIMNDLRMMVGSIAGIYEEGNEDFKNVYEEKYPNDKQMEIFNPEP